MYATLISAIWALHRGQRRSVPSRRSVQLQQAQTWRQGSKITCKVTCTGLSQAEEQLPAELCPISGPINIPPLPKKGSPLPQVPAKPNILYGRARFVDIMCWTVYCITTTPTKQQTRSKPLCPPPLKIWYKSPYGVILTLDFVTNVKPLPHWCMVVYISVPQQQNIFFSQMKRPSDDRSIRIIPVQFWEVLHTYKYFFLKLKI